MLKSLLQSRSKLLHILPYVVIAGMAVLFLVRSVFGFDWSDETYYLALPYRFSLGDRPFLDSWDIHQTGALLIHYRAHFVKRLREVTPPLHLDFSGGREKLGLAYETVSTVTDPEDSPRSILPQLLAHQESHRKAELESRQCLSGPHKDDLTVELNGMSAKTFASQGQTRTAALSLKLASREIFYQETGEWPVLLLDDVLSELDARRQEFVLRRINGGQVFITCCEDARLEGLEEGKVFHIHGGALKP